MIVLHILGILLKIIGILLLVLLGLVLLVAPSDTGVKAIRKERILEES